MQRFPRPGAPGSDGSKLGPVPDLGSGSVNGSMPGRRH